MTFLKIIICVIIVALAVFSQNRINLKKIRRARQYLLPAIAFIVGVVSVFIGYKSMGKVSQWVSVIPFIQNSDIAIINISILLEFIGIKSVLCPLLSRLCKSKKFLEATVTHFYDYDEDYDEWFLLHKWTNFRKFMFAIVAGLTVCSGVFIGLTWAYGSETVFWDVAFPCATLLVICEIYNFVNGRTKEEFEHSVLGDDADARKVSNFYKVREVYEKLLPEPLLTAHTGFEFIGTKTPLDLINELKESDSEIDNITAEYFSIDNRYMRSDVDCVQAVQQLMHRKNVVLFNPFYRDLSTYITLPLINALLSGKKCVVISGRRSNCEDIRDWLTEILSKYSHMKSLWTVKILSDREPDCDIGVLSFPQLYDKNIISVNRSFFNETDFVLLIEPSRIVNTGQVALSIIAQEMHCNDEKPVYCIFDRNTVGLVDTLSHLLHADIVNVVAPPVPRCIYSGLSWNADGDFVRQQLFDKQTRYLGNGVELAAIAVKNQVPIVSWYGETKAPIKDIKWIAGQQHPTVCRYMNQPVQQKSLYEKIRFVPSLWSEPADKEQFIIVEDEFCNIFGTLRAYLSRGKVQSFVNILSENYLLRDYMRYNKQMFLSNPNAIPSLVPDYSKTDRNTLIKLLLLMTYRPVTETEILDEFHLVGIETNDAYDILSKMLKKYTFADNSIFDIRKVRSEIDKHTAISTYTYSISNEVFDEYFADSLKNAYFILEDEKQEEGYIDAKLFSHVTQIILPGQFVTYDGKYYLAKHVSPQSGVVLRRAADLYDGRKYYRQIREYAFDRTDGEIISIKTIMDVEIAFISKDFKVHTTGYLELKDNHDIKSSRLVDFTGDPSIENYTRKYHNKTIMRIQLSDTDEKTRFTICLLLSEIFKSVFPDGWQYIAVVTKSPDDMDSVLSQTVYKLSGQAGDDYIYIIEDSDIDLGLLEVIDRNWMKFMEILADFIDWHTEKSAEAESEEHVPPAITVDEEKEEEKKKGPFTRIIEFIKSIFKRKKPIEVSIEDIIKKPEKPEGEPAAEEPQTATEGSEGAGEDREYAFAVHSSETANTEAAAGTATADEGAQPASQEAEATEQAEPEIADETVQTEGDKAEASEETASETAESTEEEAGPQGETPTSETRYQRECYLRFGFDKIDEMLQIEALRDYLNLRGWTNNSLTLARKRDTLAKQLLDLNAVNHCDFCSLPLSGVSYDVLNDGRTRCNDCSSSAISTVEDFRQLFYQILEMMEAFYDVKFRVPIRVEAADARKVADGVGRIFVPSTRYASRVLGYAQRKKDKYSVIIENGSPRLATIDTMVHELTHIWQYLNWDEKRIARIYNMGNETLSAIARDMIYEGMSMWASIQYLYQIGETYYAAQQEALAESRQDVYGFGFLLYREQYPLIKDASLIKYSPFKSFPPIDPASPLWQEIFSRLSGVQ